MQGIIENRFTKPDRFAVTYFYNEFRYIEHFKTFHEASMFVYSLWRGAKDVLIWDGLTIVWGGQ